jgi:hypothetical protein
MNISIILLTQWSIGGFVDMVVTANAIEEKSYEELIDPTCPNCRMTIPWDVDVCPHCGWQIREGEAPKEAPKPAAPVSKSKIKKGNVIAAGSVIALAALALGSWKYFPPAAILCLIALVAVIAQAAAPAD